MTSTHSPFEKPRRSRALRPGLATFGAVLVVWFCVDRLRADQVEMQNGDRYFGKVLSLTTDKLVIQSEVLGAVTLPRDKVTLITLGAMAKTNVIQTATSAPGQVNPPLAGTTNASTDISSALRNLGSDTKTIEQVRGQLLAGAGADANKKFDELVSGMASGKLNLDGIRGEAKSAATQLRELKKELGPDASEPLDAYLNILENFLKESTPPVAPVPSAALTRPNARP